MREHTVPEEHVNPLQGLRQVRLIALPVNFRKIAQGARDTLVLVVGDTYGWSVADLKILVEMTRV